LGTAATSSIFLTAILATIAFLSRTRSDVIEEHEQTHAPTVAASPAREHVMLGYYAAVAVATGALLVWAAGRPHATAANEEETSAAPATTTLTRVQATAHFPPGEIAKFRTIAQDSLAMVQAGNQRGATARIKDLETAWDDDQSTLQPLDQQAWRLLDGQIDGALKALRASNPDPATEQQTLNELLTALR
jgi:hypothetical protein